MEVQRNVKHNLRLEILVCIRVDGKADKETVVYWEVKDEAEKVKGTRAPIDFHKDVGDWKCNKT